MLYRRFLQTARDEGFVMDQAHYIGWGEPLLHPRFAELAATAYEYYPHTSQLVTTTGNVGFLGASTPSSSS